MKSKKKLTIKNHSKNKPPNQMSDNTNQQIKVCSDHPEYPVPMIWTFSFPGKEYWCPFCGASGGMFGTGNDVEATPELIQRAQRYYDFAEEFLHAKGVQVCDSCDWNGQQIDPANLPAEEKQRLQKIIADWKYDVKIEDLPVTPASEATTETTL